MRRFFVCVSLAAALCLTHTHPTRADELGDKGREILEKNQHSVVTVEVVLKMKFGMPGMGNQASEYKQDLTGTVVDPSGLTVLALSACEPGDSIQAMVAGLPEMSDEDRSFKIDTELSNIHILLDDGVELPADIVLRDRDLDLAFIRPKTKPATAVPALDLTKSARAQVLDQFIVLNRLGEAGGRAYAASVERITALVRKPRLFYVPGSELTSATLGSPAFSLDGNVLGILVMRSVSKKSGGLDLFNPRPDGSIPIILPAEDVRKAASQAPETQAAPEKSGNAVRPKTGPNQK